MTSAAVSPSAPPSEEAARAAQEPLAAPVRLAWPKPRPSARLRLAALLAALAGHAAILFALTHAPLDLRAGAEGHLVATVNVTVVNAAVLEAREAEPTQPPAPAAKEKVDTKDGVFDGKRKPQHAQEEKKGDPEKKETPQVHRPAMEAARAEPIDKPPHESEKKRTTATSERPLGGFMTRGDAATAEARIAPAAASPGTVRAYANAVAEALDRTKPKRVPAYGTVKVKLVVSPDGGFASLEILKSSGNARLDDAVLAAVRRAKLPIPPPGMGLRDRWYEFTYKFER